MYQAQNEQHTQRGLAPQIFQGSEWDSFQGEVQLQARIPIACMEDIVNARSQGRFLAEKHGFDEARTKLVTTVISELARNALLYARRGDIILAGIRRPPRRGLLIAALDQGPGIADMEKVFSSDHASDGGLGRGLSSLRQIVDEFHLSSEPGEGTQVMITVWL